MRRQPAVSYSDHAKVITLEIDVSADDIPSLDVRPREPPRPAQRVLLLDDLEDFREVLSDHLNFRGFQVTSVPSGVEGLGEIRKGFFDLIICDMLMPRSGGEMFYWAATRMRPAMAQRFIFFTGHQNQPTIDFFFRRVNATVLLKPFKLSDFDARIGDVLRRLG